MISHHAGLSDQKRFETDNCFLTSSEVFDLRLSRLLVSVRLKGFAAKCILPFPDSVSRPLQRLLDQVDFVVLLYASSELSMSFMTALMCG